MKKFIQRKLKDQKGMTLIELLAVIVIIAIIAAIAIPAIGTIIENSRHGAVKSDYQQALSAANLYFAENTAADVTVSQMTDYLEDAGSLDGSVKITKASGGNTISGKAAANGNNYDITTGVTNSYLSSIANDKFGDDYLVVPTP